MIRYIKLLVAFLMLTPMTVAAHGETFSTTNIQLLYGSQFDDRYLVLDTPHSLQQGLEWYLHRNKQITSSVPQAMVKWVW